MNDKNLRADVFMSLVTVFDEHTRDAVRLVTEAHFTLSNGFANYELLIVDNGVTGPELCAMKKLLRELPAIRIVRLARVSSVDDAAFAGLNMAIGDYVLFCDLNTDSAQTLNLAMAELITPGVDLLQGLSAIRSNGNLLNRLGRGMFYAYNSRFLGINMNPRATYLVGFSRRALNNATGLRRSHKYLRHIAQHLGYPVTEHEYYPTAPVGRTHSVRSGYSGAIEMISSYSIHPLRVVTLLGLIAALLNLIYAVYVLLVAAFKANVVEGWTTSSLQMSAMFFVLCLILVIQSEYIGRILSEARGDKPYLVKEELESDFLIPNTDRRNISE